MAATNATERELVTLADHEVRALTEKMSVLPETGWARGAPDCYLVVSESGASYRVDAREARCSCPSQFYRGGPCKHTARVAYATGDRAIPEWVQEHRVDDQLGDHIQSDSNE